MSASRLALTVIDFYLNKSCSYAVVANMALKMHLFYVERANSWVVRSISRLSTMGITNQLFEEE
jgi:hypothetical protein